MNKTEITSIFSVDEMQEVYFYGRIAKAVVKGILGNNTATIGSCEVCYLNGYDLDSPKWELFATANMKFKRDIFSAAISNEKQIFLFKSETNDEYILECRIREINQVEVGNEIRLGTLYGLKIKADILNIEKLKQ